MNPTSCRKHRSLVSILALFLTCTFPLAAAELERPVPKQLAGPPSEFPLMKVAEPVLVQSRSAMLPVTLVAGDDGTLRWQGSFPVANPENLRLLLLHDGSTWDVTLTEPETGKTISMAELQPEILEASVGTYSGDLMTFEAGLRTGRWGISVSSQQGGDGFLVVGDTNSPYLLDAGLTTGRLLVGETLGLTAFARAAEAGDNSDLSSQWAPARTAAETPALRWAEATVLTPSGGELRVKLADDGHHGDGRAGDGVFGGSFVAAEEGTFTARILAEGATADGATPFLRSTQHVFPVFSGDLKLTRAAALGVDGERALEIDLALASSSELADRVYAYAQVWGHGASGEAVPVAWVGGIRYVEDGSLSLRLDGRWIQRAEAQGPFELRQVRIQEVNTFVPLLEIDTLGLEVADSSALSSGFGFGRGSGLSSGLTSAIDEGMLMGPRPRGLEEAARGLASGSRLLLVHGYCSGNVWGPVAGQFSSASVFQDINANRSHDAFARRILSFGSPYSSYGIVAHSQGGAASLHLYTYYWSGLDNATGPRLIQSVGTPYQGTPLAGNIALLGQIFGVGCGSNYDLTYSGASAWLAQIPTWARQKVFYFTTSFTDKWWRYDYCNLASDLLLGDPDDGVVEKSKGQLSSANNRGHKTGWCHTSGMRDPNQVTDSSRNANMNANAAR